MELIGVDGQALLYVACKEGQTSDVSLLLNDGEDPNVPNRPNVGTTDKYPILAACRCHRYDAVELLLEYNADVTVRDEKGKTAMHHVLEYEPRRSSETDKRSVIVQLLLDKGADTDAASEDGETPFYIACSKGLVSIVAKMLERGAKVDGNSCKKRPLNAACSNKQVSVVQLLLTNGADPNKIEHNIACCILALHIALTAGDSELVELLHKSGANIDVTDVNGNTALHHIIDRYHPSTAIWSRYSDSAMRSIDVMSFLNILLENKADVNIVNSCGETPLYRAASRELLDVVSKMLQVYGGHPNKGSSDKNPLTAACLKQNVELVNTLLKHGADPNIWSTNCDPDSEHKLPLFVAVDKSNVDIITSLLSAGASVNAMNHEGRNIVCFAAEKLTSSYYSTAEMRKRLSALRLLLQHGANVNMQQTDGRSPLHVALSALYEGEWRRRGHEQRTCLIELLQLMVKHGAVLQDYCFQLYNICRQSPNSETLKALATFDGQHEFIVDLFRAAAGFQLIASCCSALATSSREAKSIRLCQAAVLAGYTPSAGELQHLQLAATIQNAAGGLLKQLVNWLNEDGQQVPSLLRQCRVAIRRHLSTAVHYQTILPAIDKLPLPHDVKQYLQFDGNMTEVDLSTNQTTEGTSAENEHHLLSPYNSEHSDYDWSDVDDYYNSDYGYDYGYGAYDSDDDISAAQLWWWL